MERNNAIEAVIFDCDGVLVDSEPIANRLFHRCLVNLGLSLSAAETNETFMGRSMDDCIAGAEAMLGRPVPNDVWTDLALETERAFDRELEPVRFVTDALEALSLPRCVASSGSHAKIAHSLALTNLDVYFEHVCSADDVTAGKPAPDLFLLAARTLGIAAGRCAVIEDSVPGVRGAVDAGATVFGYCERTSAAELAAAGARTFDDMRELPGLLHARAD